MSEATAMQFKALRKRAGYSLDALAKAMGYRGASSIQRFEKETPGDPAFLGVEVVRKLDAAVVGRGNPPISSQDVYSLASPEWRAAHAAAMGDLGPLDSLEDERRVPEVKVGEGGMLVETDTWRLPERLMEQLFPDGLPRMLVCLHREQESFFVDRTAGLVSIPGEYAIADATCPGGFRIESYEQARLNAERRKAILMSGVLGRVVGKLTLG